MIRKFHINDDPADVASNLGENKDLELENFSEIAAQRSQNAFDGLKTVCNRSVTKNHNIFAEIFLSSELEHL